MKRKISICAIILTAALLTAVLWNLNRTIEPEDTQPLQAQTDTEPAEELVVVNTGNTISFLYVIKDCDGRLSVYKQETGELFMETGIRSMDLPEEIQNRLSEGIGFSDEESLFDFLESYSS